MNLVSHVRMWVFWVRAFIFPISSPRHLNIPCRRLLSICQVALGESAKYYSFSSTITSPPDGFHSTHGVKRNNEYAIYELDQQRLVYLVEVSWLPHDKINFELEQLPIVHDQQSISNSFCPVEIPMLLEDEVIQVAEQDYGLICPSSGKLVPLKSFHIRSQIVDTTIEVNKIKTRREEKNHTRNVI